MSVGSTPQTSGQRVYDGLFELLHQDEALVVHEARLFLRQSPDQEHSGAVASELFADFDACRHESRVRRPGSFRSTQELDEA